jgi:hypothetical protein
MTDPSGRFYQCGNNLHIRKKPRLADDASYTPIKLMSSER